MQTDIISAAKEFIVLYYNFAVKNKSSLYKFYDPEAIIVHPDVESPIKVSELIEKRKSFEPGTQINVLKYSIVPTEGSANITCNIQIIHPNSVQYATQCFTLTQRDNKFYVVAEYIYYQENKDLELLEIPSFKRPNKPYKPRGQFGNPHQFAPYKPRQN